MAITWFCIWQGAHVAPVEVADLRRLTTLVEQCRGVLAAHIMTPASANDPYFPEPEGSPSLILQLDFARIDMLEALLRRSGELAPLADPQFMPGLSSTRPEQAAMVARRYPLQPGPQPTSMTYWVEYVGQTADDKAWLSAYASSHPALLARLPDIRLIELYTPAVAICEIALSERDCLQRNKAVWDTPEAMNAAMASPVRMELRADMAAMPAFTGEARHYPFLTRSFTFG